MVVKSSGRLIMEHGGAVDAHDLRVRVREVNAFFSLFLVSAPGMRNGNCRYACID